MKRKGSGPITPQKAAEIRHLCGKMGLFQHQAAALLKINQGRVSEVMTGKRHPGVPPAEQLSFPL